MQGQNIIHCEKCGSNKVTKLPMFLILFASAGCMVWIPVIGWILAPLLFLAAIVWAVLPKGKVLMRCEECKHVTAVEKPKYKEFKEYLGK